VQYAFRGATVGELLRQNRGQGPGFDWCRVSLALMVVLAHSYNLSYGSAQSGFMGRFPLGPFYLAILPMFFGLSGFLVTGSALRLRDTRTFIVFRALRIIPALMVEVTLSALILGPLLTTVPLQEYFADKHFYAYFGNIIGRIRFGLPGVFIGLPLDGIVNGNLWTLHPEFGCYILIAVLMLTRVAYNTRILVILWLAATVLAAAYNLATGALEPPIVSSLLVYYFVTGMVAFHLKDHITINTHLFIIAASLTYVLQLLPQTSLIVPVPMMYVVIWLGMQKFTRFELSRYGDFSYGIYLFSYPLQQTICYLFPTFRQWWIVFPLSAILSILVAAVSWHYIEKPSLQLKKLSAGRRREPQPAGQRLQIIFRKNKRAA